ncbi:MAG: aromatic ring-opening dioxygenase [Sphingomonas sp.]|uniref:DOPA 4,5-dioxygenase family protein n=1 Tax=Sphingomonas sp. TaxID=28214 RepID=UPI001AD4D0F1|nr:DOPA 4,5-dioxygenase family protein [Sphingomonas sp.]MBN8807734.1 aromatic ring-opening dioxygenase [Sphingomonas sp.]
MSSPDSPWHAHIYYEADERAAAMTLHDKFEEMTAQPASPILFTGSLTDRSVGPHPIPQFEIHFRARDRDAIAATIEQSGLRALIHPLTDDDLADHTSLAQWIGEPIALDTSVLDPPGVNQGVARFGKSDF